MTAAVFLPSITAPWFSQDRAEILASSTLRPLTELTFAVTPAAWAAHLLQLSLHLGCAWLLCRRLESSLPERAARIGAAIFALHPVQTEAICALPARGILLAALFCLVAWTAWEQGRHWLAAAVFAAAPLSHEQAALFPLALILQSQARPWRPLAVMSLFSFVSLLRAPHPAFDAGWVAAQGIATLRQLWLLIAPLSLTPAPDLNAPLVLAAVAWSVVGVTAAFGLTRRRTQAASLLLAGLALLAPAALLVSPSEMGTDRLLYLPMMCWAALAGLLFRGARTWPLVAAGSALLLVTCAQCRLWMDERALWTEAARLAPDRADIQLRLSRIPAPE